MNNNSQPPFGGYNNGYNNGYNKGYNNRPQRPTENFIDSVKTCFYKYVDFNGRASRGEFWWWTLFTVLVSLCLSATGSWIFSLLNVATILPSLAVLSRRLHDIGKGAGYMFVGLIPVVGWILMLIWLTEPGEFHPNRFGANPYNYNDGLPPKPF